MSQLTVQSESESLQEHNRVALTENISAHQLEEGDQGVVVSVYPDSIAYEVKFFNFDETTRCVLTLTSSQVRSIPNEDEF